MVLSRIHAFSTTLSISSPSSVERTREYNIIGHVKKNESLPVRTKKQNFQMPLIDFNNSIDITSNEVERTS